MKKIKFYKLCRDRENHANYLAVGYGVKYTVRRDGRAITFYGESHGRGGYYITEAITGMAMNSHANASEAADFVRMNFTMIYNLLCDYINKGATVQNMLAEGCRVEEAQGVI